MKSRATLVVFINKDEIYTVVDLHWPGSWSASLSYYGSEEGALVLFFFFFAPTYTYIHTMKTLKEFKAYDPVTRIHDS